MEKLADHGNGNYAYIDTLAEARKVLVSQAGGTLVTIAKDVKIQVEWNPRQVKAYRLIGYENRLLQAQDFNDDKKDAGDIGAGHAVTALYEVVPAGEKMALPGVDPLKVQSAAAAPAGGAVDELLTVKLRYKEPDGKTSRRLTVPVPAAARGSASTDFRFAAAVAGFGLLLRDSEHRGNASFDAVRTLAEGALGQDPHGYRAELVRLVAAAQRLKGDAPQTRR